MELSSAESAGEAGSSGHGRERLDKPTQTRDRPWLAVYWKCCRTYSRIYRNPGGEAYHGQCPQCGKQTRAAVGPHGIASRFFTAE